jgi:hypothetical protein
MERFGTVCHLLTSILVAYRLWSDAAALIWFEKAFVSLALFYATFSLYHDDVKRELKRLRAEAHPDGVTRS